MSDSDSVDCRLLVRPRIARQMLGGCGAERLYQLINSGQLRSFRDGRCRLILVSSIHDYVERKLAQQEYDEAHSGSGAP